MSKTTTSIEISWQTIWRVLMAIVAVWAILKLQTIIFYLLFALLFAVALSPFISWFQTKGLKRGTSLALVILIIVSVVFAMAALVLGSLVNAVVDFTDNLPQYVDDLSQYESLQDHIPDLRNSVESINFSDLLRQGVSQGSSLISGASRAFEAGLFTFFFTIYMLLEKDYLMRIIRRITPSSWKSRSRDIQKEFVDVVGGYIRGQLLTSTMMGVISYLIFRVLGVPNAAALAIIAGVTDIIPVVGGLIGLIPATLVALTVSPGTAVLVILLVQSYSTLSNYLVRPKIFGSSLDLSPFLVTLATTAGLSLFGIPGILLALPAAAMIGFILTEYHNIPILEEENDKS